MALDAADVEFHQVEELARLQCEETVKATRIARTNVRFAGPTGGRIARELAELLDRHRSNEELLLLALLGRVVVARLRHALGVAVSVDDLKLDLSRTRTASDGYAQLVEKKADGFTTWFRKAAFEASTRSSLRAGSRDAHANVSKLVTSLDGQLRAIQEEVAVPVRALVEVDAGELRGVRVLPAHD